MKLVDSQALGMVNKALGLTGTGAATTEFLDSLVDQVFDVAPVVRRGRTPGITQGLFYATMDNVHGAADTLFTDVQPYTDSIGVSAPFPSPIPDTFDLWLIASSVLQISGTGTLAGLLSVQYGDQFAAFSLDDSGAAVTPPAFGHILQTWDTLTTIAGQEFGSNALSPDVTKFHKIRLPRSQHTHITFRSTSSAIATFRCALLLALMPVSLGQDAAF